LTFAEHILEDDALAGRMKVRMSEALARIMDESDWKKFSTLHGLSRWITDHPRFLRSLSWGDPDHEGHVLDLLNHLFDDDPGAFNELLNRPDVRTWLKKEDPGLIELWEGSEDPLITALSHSLSDVAAVSDVIDLSQYTKRIQDALPSDPYLAIGATKDMLEATMRTILHRRGVADVEKYDFPALATQCLTELGLISTSPPKSDGEKHLRKIASSAKTMIETANALRNLAGTGHGRVVGAGEVVTDADASLVASSGLILAAWMLRHDASST
jgi:hypothetical protein